MDRDRTWTGPTGELRGLDRDRNREVPGPGQDTLLILVGPMWTVGRGQGQDVSWVVSEAK